MIAEKASDLIKEDYGIIEVHRAEAFLSTCLSSTQSLTYLGKSQKKF